MESVAVFKTSPHGNNMEEKPGHPKQNRPESCRTKCQIPKILDQATHQTITAIILNNTAHVLKTKKIIMETTDIPQTTAIMANTSV